MRWNIFTIIILISIIIIMGQLNYPIDQQSKKIIEQVADEFMKNKIFDLFWDKEFYYLAMPESFDSWTVVGNGSYATQQLITTASQNDEVTISSDMSYHNFLSFQKRQRFRTYISMGTITNSVAKVGVGRINDGAAVSALFYGFQITNGAIYGYTDANGAETTVNLGISVVANSGADINIYTLEARYEPNGKIVFYVGETKYETADAIVASRQATVERGKIELATGFYDTQFPENVVDFHYRIKTTTTATRDLNFTMFEFVQER